MTLGMLLEARDVCGNKTKVEFVGRGRGEANKGTRLMAISVNITTSTM